MTIEQYNIQGFKSRNTKKFEHFSYGFNKKDFSSSIATDSRCVFSQTTLERTCFKYQ